MEAIAEIIMGIMALLIEITFHAVVFIFMLLMAIFSPRYRGKLRDQWDTSNWQRFGLVLDVMMYSAILVAVVLFWSSFLDKATDEVATNDPDRSINLHFSMDEVREIRETKNVDQLVEAAGTIIKRKLAERKEKVEPPNLQE